jgi:hypothetical protein
MTLAGNQSFKDYSELSFYILEDTRDNKYLLKEEISFEEY